jgi:hypothetical protein
MFMKMVFLYTTGDGMKEKKELVAFQRTLVITRYPLEQLTRATTLPRYGTGLSSKFMFFSAGSLTLYKGL